MARKREIWADSGDGVVRQMQTAEYTGMLVRRIESCDFFLQILFVTELFCMSRSQKCTQKWQENVKYGPILVRELYTKCERLNIHACSFVA